ncbi:hypothetical protein CMV_015587 [Castanea mollissima]|uniref:Cupin type-1 domain-containing protein n=1 Tax=Castanea mollissima TaxID=60419 RepID=A0A8J4R504_9ROSI|nr:hypothetical protein CMV_015587 [Castanea mollissima]
MQSQRRPMYLCGLDQSASGGETFVVDLNCKEPKSRHSGYKTVLSKLLFENGVAGIVLPESEEKVLAIKKGDAIALPFGAVTWWYNEEDTELIVLFLGDTSKAHKAGEFTDFFLTGSNGIFTGFSTKFEPNVGLG